MDQKLLKALENIGNGLEALVDALSEREEAKSDSGKAIQSGDFGKQLQSISTQLQSIKLDTEEILKNQKTLLGISKEKEKEKKDDSKTKEVEDAGDPKKESRLKSGIGTILLIAVAVLAIGMAFKLVGKIDFLSVIALGLAIYVVAQAFEKIAALKLTLRESLVASLTMITMSIAITASSYILQGIVPVSIIQLMTAVAIAGVFAVLGMSLEKLGLGIAAFHKILGNKAAWVTPLIMVAIALAITASSWIMTGITPIGITQAITAIAIAAVFAIVGISMQKIAVAVVIAYEVLGKSATWKLPLILVAIATAITVSSWIMQLIVPIGFAQALTAIAISFVFMIIGWTMEKISISVAIAYRVLGKSATWKLPLILVAIAVAITASSWIFKMTADLSLSQFLIVLGIGLLFALLSYVMPDLALGVIMVDKILGKNKIFLLPLVFVALALAIMLSSQILAQTADIQFMMMLKIIVFSITLAIVGLVLGFAAFFIEKAFGIKNIIKGSVSFVIIATALMISSLLISEGDYRKYPSWKYTLSIGLAFLTLGAVASALSKMGGPGTFIKGGLAIVIIATTIVVASQILSLGVYKDGKYPNEGWSIGVSLALTLFAAGAFVLGLAVFGPQALIFAAGLAAILVVAGTIVGVAKILEKGNYQNKGFTQWALTVSLLYMVFTPIIMMLGAVALASQVIKFFGGKDPFAEANKSILTIADTIVQVSHRLGGGNYKGGPTKEWASGISIALGAFSKVYQMLLDNAFWSAFGMGGIGPTDFANGILAVSEGIVTAANKFSESNAAFKNPPPVEWARGVGLAIGAFSPVYKILTGEGRSAFDIMFGPAAPTVKDMKNAIIAITEGIITAAEKFGKYSGKFDEGKYPSTKWGQGVGSAIKAFAPVFKVLSEMSWYRSSDEMIWGMSQGIKAVSRAIISAGKIFSEAGRKGLKFNKEHVPSPEWGSGVSKAIAAFAPIFKQLSGTWFESGTETVDNMIYGIKQISKAIVGAAEHFSTPGVDWSSYPSKKWAYGTGKAIKTYAKLAKPEWQELDFNIIPRIAKSMARTASILYKSKEAFETKIPTNFFKNTRKIMLDFQSLTHELMEKESESKSMGEKFANLFGAGDRTETTKDPILIMANRMVKLAKGYDALAKSIIKLGAAMKSINMKNAQELGGFTKNLLKGAAKPSDMSTMTANRGEMAEMKRMKKEELKKKEDEKKKPNPLQKDMQQIIKLLKNIDKSVSSVDDYILEKSGIASSGIGGGLFGSR